VTVCRISSNWTPLISPAELAVGFRDIRSCDPIRSVRFLLEHLRQFPQPPPNPVHLLCNKPGGVCVVEAPHGCALFVIVRSGTFLLISFHISFHNNSHLVYNLFILKRILCI
jgi:hypothetical protein